MRRPGHEALVWAPEHLCNEVERRHPRCVLRWGVRAQKWVIATPLNPWRSIVPSDRDPWTPEMHRDWFPVLWIDAAKLKGMRTLDHSIVDHLDDCFIGRGKEADEKFLRDLEAEKAESQAADAKAGEIAAEAAEDADYMARARSIGPKTGFIRPNTAGGWSLSEAHAAAG